MLKHKFVFFDLGNVILNFDHSLIGVNVKQKCGLPPDSVNEFILGGELQTHYETGLITSEQFHAEFCKEFGEHLSLEELKIAASDIFELNTETVSIIERLHANRVSIGVLSNTCEAHWEFAVDRFPPVKEYFSKRVLSYEAKSMKPDKVIYEHAIELANCAPNEIFFMDDRQENVDGAIAVGIDAALFVGASRLEKDLSERGLI